MQCSSTGRALCTQKVLQAIFVNPDRQSPSAPSLWHLHSKPLAFTPVSSSRLLCGLRLRFSQWEPVSLVFLPAPVNFESAPVFQSVPNHATLQLTTVFTMQYKATQDPAHVTNALGRDGWCASYNCSLYHCGGEVMWP
jgi:hypothetical protein